MKPSIFDPYAEALRKAHEIAYNLPAKPKSTPEPINEIRAREHAATTNPALAAWYDRPGCYSGD